MEGCRSPTICGPVAQQRVTAQAITDANQQADVFCAALDACPSGDVCTASSPIIIALATYTCVTDEDCIASYTDTFTCYCLTVPKGACCIPSSGCTPDLTPTECSDLDGFYQGDDTETCAVSEFGECVPTGACCDPIDEVCTDNVPQADCLFEWTEGVACVSACKKEACCLQPFPERPGPCDMLTLNSCMFVNGTDMGFGTVCEGDADGDGADGLCGDGCPNNRNKMSAGSCGCECAPVNVPQSETIVYAKNRFLSFQPRNAECDTALRVTFPNPMPGVYNLPGWNGAELWVMNPTTRCELASVSAASLCGANPTFTSAALGCTPDYRDWAGFGMIHVTHEGIIPGAIYEVKEIHAGCDAMVEVNYSGPLSIPTSRWGDVCGTFTQGTWSAPDGRIDVTTDVIAVLEKFRNVPRALIKARAENDFREVDFKINITGISRILDAFRGLGYPFFPSGTDPCP